MSDNPYQPPEPTDPDAGEPYAGDLVCVARFFDAATAHIARSVLDSEGIFACLDSESTNTMMPHVGTALGGVKLLVQADQVDKAKSLLAAHSEADLLDEDDGEEHESPEDDDGDEEESPELREREGHIRRAWTAAILGLLLCPPLLSVYALVLLIRHGLLVDDPRWPKDWRINAALALIFLGTGIGAIVIIAFFDLNRF